MSPLHLPFEDAGFDAVVCQFGVMFFPDRARAFSKARRFSARAGFSFSVTTALASLFPDDPPRFLARIPHGYHDPRLFERDLANGGFTASPRIDTLAARSRGSSPRVPAVAYCQETPLRNEIETREASRLGEATDLATEAIAQRFGRGAVDGKIQAGIVSIER